MKCSFGLSDGNPAFQFLNLSSFAEQMLVHEHAIVKIREDMPLDRAALIGLDVHLEFVPMTVVSDIAIAWDMVRNADRPNGGMLFDTWHFFRGTPDFGVLAQVGQFIWPTVQAYTRVDVVVPGVQPEGTGLFRALTLGVSYLPFRWTNRARAAVELTHALDGITRSLVEPGTGLGLLPSNDPQTVLRVQLTFGF